VNDEVNRKIENELGLKIYQFEKKEAYYYPLNKFNFIYIK